MDTYDDTLPDDLTAGLSDDPFADDLDEQIAAREPQRWATRTTFALAGLFLLVGGFLAGAQVQKHFGATPAAASTTGRTAGGPAFAGGRTGGTTQTAPNTRTGTVKLVDGTTIYLQTGDGQIITVRTNGSTAVQTVQAGALADLAPGTQVSVEGPAGSDGAVTATKVTRTK